MPPALRCLLHVSFFFSEKIASTVHTGTLENLEVYLCYICVISTTPKLRVAYSAIRVR